jgi:hypothetical protein
MEKKHHWDPSRLVRFLAAGPPEQQRRGVLKSAEPDVPPGGHSDGGHDEPWPGAPGERGADGFERQGHALLREIKPFGAQRDRAAQRFGSGADNLLNSLGPSKSMDSFLNGCIEIGRPSLHSLNYRSVSGRP